MHHTRKITHTLFLLLVLLLTGSLHAQVTSSLRMGIQSPTAASLGEYGDVPVGLYTGVPSISIPLYQVQGRDLSLPISLSYHAGGVKVEELPGWVGLGWSLNAGGVITRTVRGLPDEENDLGYYYTGDQLDGGNWDSPSQTYLDSVFEGESDSEPDQFFLVVA